MPRLFDTRDSGTPRKAIVRTRDGQVHLGFVAKKALGPKFAILNRQAEEVPFNLRDVKAIFFVKDFKGDPSYEEIRFLNKQKASPAVWVRLKFFDGETLEGRIENNVSLLLSGGFYLWPSDSETNNECAYVSKAALVDFAILSAD